MAQPATDFELLGRYVRGRDEGAFRELVRRHSALVYAAAVRVLGRSPDAEDVSQATFLLLSRRARRLTAQRRQVVAGWLFRTARFVARQVQRASRRRRRREVRAADMQRQASAGDGAQREMSRTLLEAIDALPSRYRDVVVLRYLSGRTHQETAAELALPESTVSTRLARALKRLRARLVRAGAALSVTALLGVLKGSAAEAAGLAPPTLAASVTAACSGTAVPTTVLHVVELTGKAILWTKVKTAAACGAAAAALVTAGTFMVLAGSPQAPHGANHEQAPGVIDPVKVEAVQGDAQPAQRAGEPAAETPRTFSVDCYRLGLKEVIQGELLWRGGVFTAAPYCKIMYRPFFTMKGTGVTAREVLREVARQGNFELEFHDGTPVLWKKIDDGTLNELVAAAREGDPAHQQAQALIRQFTAGEFDLRQQAVEKLIQMGPEILPLVERTLARTDDAEVKLRCDMVIKGIAAAPGHAPSRVREKAYERLADTGDLRALAALVDIARRDEMPPALIYRLRHVAGGGEAGGVLEWVEGGKAFGRRLAETLDVTEHERLVNALRKPGRRPPDDYDVLVGDFYNRIELIAVSGWDGSVAFLAGLLKKPEYEKYRYHIVRALGRARAESAEKVIAGMLEDEESVPVRAQALQSLALRPSGLPAGDVVLRLAREDDSPRVRGNAALFLAVRRHPGASDLLIEMAGRETDRQALDPVLLGLSFLGGERETDAIIGGLKHDDARVRSAAVDGLEHARGSRSAADAVAEVLRSDPDEDVRQGAAHALGRIRVSSAIPVLIEALQQGKTAWTRQSAAHGLGYFGDEEDAVKALRQALADSDCRVKGSAFLALAHAGQENVPVLLSALERESKSRDPVRIDCASWADILRTHFPDNPQVLKALADFDKRAGTQD